MFNTIDSEDKIVLAKMSKLLAKYSHAVIKKNGDGKSLLECSGLSSLVDEHIEWLTPHCYNGSWENPNPKFNSGLAINEICSKISSNKKALGLFLNEFLSRIDEIDVNDIDNFKNYLEILGYKLNIKKDNYYYSYSLLPYTEGVLERQSDVSYLVNMLNQNNSNLLSYYTEAISTYGNSEYQGCIGNCRTLFEKLFSSLDNDNNDYAKGILNATNEVVPTSNSKTPKLSIKSIFTYWIETKKGFNRYRLFITMYSLMSALGPHGEEIPSKEDALLCLRITEDILIWYFQKNDSLHKYKY